MKWGRRSFTAMILGLHGIQKVYFNVTVLFGRKEKYEGRLI
jgi:hypothetical protein